ATSVRSIPACTQAPARRLGSRALTYDPVSDELIPMSGSEQGLAAHAQRLTIDTPAAGCGEEGDGLGDVDRQAALTQTIESSSGLADEQRDSGGHLGLDEAGRDGVDGAAELVGEPRREG